MSNNDSNNTDKGLAKHLKRKFSGEVISAKMDKTVVVRVHKVKIIPHIKKRVAVTKNYKVHDERNTFKEGDKIDFMECRPLSKEKRWRAIYKKEISK